MNDSINYLRAAAKAYNGAGCVWTAEAWTALTDACVSSWPEPDPDWGIKYERIKTAIEKGVGADCPEGEPSGEELARWLLAEMGWSAAWEDTESAARRVAEGAARILYDLRSNYHAELAAVEDAIAARFADRDFRMAEAMGAALMELAASKLEGGAK